MSGFGSSTPGACRRWIASGITVVAGRRVAETLPAAPGDTYRATFEFLPPTDGIDLMAGPWVVRERTVSRSGAPPLYLRTYFSPELDATPGLAEAYLDDSQRYIERYSREIGDYPYDEFSIVAGPLPTGFGMPTLTYLGEAVIRLPFIRKTSLGHEVLHNWWTTLSRRTNRRLPPAKCVWAGCAMRWPCPPTSSLRYAISGRAPTAPRRPSATENPPCCS